MRIKLAAMILICVLLALLGCGCEKERSADGWFDELGDPSVPFSREESKQTGKPIDPAKFAKHAGGYCLVLTNIDQAMGTGVLTSDITTNEIAGRFSVRVDLATGKLSAIPPAKPGKREAYNPNVLPSPAGEYELCYYEKPERWVAVKDAKGKQVGKVSESEFAGFDSMQWSARGDCFSFTSGVESLTDMGSGLYVYFLKEHRHRNVTKLAISKSFWSGDGRYLAYISPTKETSKTSVDRALRDCGQLSILDSSNDFKRVARVGTMVSKAQSSQDGSRVAFIELLKDEYGDYATYAIKVLDIKPGRVGTLATSRREPKFIWAEDDSLAVATCDKYGVPSLSLLNVRDGVQTTLVTDRNYASIEPVGYALKQRTVVYTATTSRAGQTPSDFWSVSPGRLPVRLFPKQSSD